MRDDIKSNLLIDTEWDNMKERIAADMQWNERITLEMNAVNKETDNILKQLNHDCLKIPATEIE